MKCATAANLFLTVLLAVSICLAGETGKKIDLYGKSGAKSDSSNRMNLPDLSKINGAQRAPASDSRVQMTAVCRSSDGYRVFRGDYGYERCMEESRRCTSVNCAGKYGSGFSIFIRGN